MSEDLVSVIIPTYNYSCYLGEAILSVLGQTYQNFEIIVIDDDSTDDTQDVIASIKDQRLKYMKISKAGNYCARNIGIKSSRGEYIAFLDADDMWMINKLKDQVAIFKEHRDVGLCCTDHYLFFDKNKDNLYVDSVHGFRQDFIVQNNFVERMLEDNAIITSSVMVRKTCFEHLGMFKTVHQNAMDYEMWLRIVLNYKVHYLKNRYVLKRMHNLNISSDKIRSLNALLYVFKEMDSFVDKSTFFNIKYKRLIKERLKKILYFLGIENISIKNYSEALKHLYASKYSKKNIFKYFAILVARLRIGFLIPVINLYRVKRQKSELSSLERV